MSEFFGDLLGFLDDLPATITNPTNPLTETSNEMTHLVIHASGRYDKTPAQIKRAIDAYYSKNPLVVSFTEYQNKDRRHVLRVPGRNLIHGVGHDGLAELAISTRESDKLARMFVKEMSPKTYYRVGGAIAPPKGFAVVAFKSYDGLSYGTLHTANTDGNTRFTGAARRIDVYKSNVQNVAKYCSTITGPIVLGADWNCILGRPNEMRSWLDATLKTAGLKRVKGNNGLDGFYTRDVVPMECRTLRRNASSDHAPVMLRFKMV